MYSRNTFLLQMHYFTFDNAQADNWFIAQCIQELPHFCAQTKWTWLKFVSLLFLSLCQWYMQPQTLPFIKKKKASSRVQQTLNTCEIPSLKPSEKQLSSHHASPKHSACGEDSTEVTIVTSVYSDDGAAHNLIIPSERWSSLYLLSSSRPASSSSLLQSLISLSSGWRKLFGSSSQKASSIPASGATVPPLCSSHTAKKFSWQ